MPAEAVDLARTLHVSTVLYQKARALHQGLRGVIIADRARYCGEWDVAGIRELEA